MKPFFIMIKDFKKIMSPLIEAAGHWMKIRQLIQNIKGLPCLFSDALLTLAWFHNWENKSVQIAVKTIFE